jgi:hypothetical protein
MVGSAWALLSPLPLSDTEPVHRWKLPSRSSTGDRRDESINPVNNEQPDDTQQAGSQARSRPRRISSGLVDFVQEKVPLHR